jgi:hypothetical protein
MIHQAGSVRLLTCALALAAGGCGSTQAAQPPAAAPPAAPAALQGALPAPADVIGPDAGRRAARYAEMESYLKALDAASPLVTLTPYATSHEGRTLYYLTITSSANHARLDRIKADNRRLADPRRTSAAEADAIIEKLPAVAWLAYSIHGDELSPCDAALLVAHTLAASNDPSVAALRDELVILIDPLQNPDGRERYLAQLQALQGKVVNTDYRSMQHAGLWSAGRGNHYLFDLNRDWLPMVHPETRGRVAAIAEWNPHFLVDSHEMSGLDTYLFDPPREPMNASLAPATMEWRRAFSADQARAFDRHGWSYYTREWYEEWYPGYTNAWANLRGTIGLLYEAPALNSSALTQASGEVITYHDAVQRNVVGTLANLETLRHRRRELVRAFHQDRRWAVSDEGPMQETFLLAPGGDRSRVQRLLELLARHGLEHEVAAGPVEARGAVDLFGARAESMKLPAGTAIFGPRQPLRRLMHAILEFDPRMTDAFVLEERTELERHRESRLYDTTAWNLAMAYGVQAYWADSVSAAAGAAPPPPPPAPPPANAARYGYVIDGQDSAVWDALSRLFAAGCKPRVASKAFSVHGRDFGPGAILLRRHENPPALNDAIAAIQAAGGAAVVTVDTALAEEGPDLGGLRFHLLHEPRVAVASQWPVATTSFGAVWHLLDARLGLRTSPINVQELGSIDLRSYNVLILPDAGGLAAVLDESTRHALEHWLKGGGTLIALGGSASVLAQADIGLSSVRRRRDVLERLEEYAEAVARERAARQIKVDVSKLWGAPEAAPAAPPAGDAGVAAPAPAVAPAAEPKAGGGAGDGEALARRDEWQRLFSPQGVFVEARCDVEHWLCFGLPERLPVLVSGSTVLMAARPAETAVRLQPAGSLRLSGLLWPEAAERLADGAYAVRESSGRGQVILFASDPFVRGYLEGSGRMLINAVMLGPGMGTDQPIPW